MRDVPVKQIPLNSVSLRLAKSLVNRGMWKNVVAKREKISP